jgi:hypothetical protein
LEVSRGIRPDDWRERGDAAELGTRSPATGGASTRSFAGRSEESPSCCRGTRIVIMSHRVRAGFSLALPTPPGMKVRTGRFTNREHTLSSGVSVGFHPRLILRERQSARTLTCLAADRSSLALSANRSSSPSALPASWTDARCSCCWSTCADTQTGRRQDRMALAGAQHQKVADLCAAQPPACLGLGQPVRPPGFLRMRPHRPSDSSSRVRT